MKIALNTERMKGHGEFLVEGYQVNYLYGLDEICKKYLNASSVVLELGVNNGVSTALFANYANKVVAIDRRMTRRLAGLLANSSNIEFHQMDFADFYQKDANLYDLVYIDGSHRYKDVKTDILKCLNRVKKGGILSGHDFNSYTSDVKKAVTETFGLGKVEIYSDSSWSVIIN